MTRSLFYNARSAARIADFFPSRRPLEFHNRLPGYKPTPLISAPALARSLGVGQLWIKDESRRLDMPSFKILGASWAIYQALGEHRGGRMPPWITLKELVRHLAPLRPLKLVAATDGNHGRAVAHMAVLLGLEAHIFAPAGTAPARIQAIEQEGASVTIVDGSYDDAVELASREASARCLVISDTSWPGYETIPRWVIEGYSTIFWEIDEQLRAWGESGPDLVVVQIGVGALAAAVVRHYRRSTLTTQPKIVGVEPTRAACVLASMRAGRLVEVPGPHLSIMAGLNCGTPSMVAWPIISSSIDLFVAIDDDRAREGMCALAGAGISAGETGAAGVGGLIDLLTDADAARSHAFLEIDSSTRVLVLATEGVTDPDAYADIVGDASTALPWLYAETL